MTFDATVVRVMIASPGDTTAERASARDVIAAWNSEHASDLGVVLLPVGWETDSIPEWNIHPQAALNRQLVDQCDVLLGFFWTRLGSATENAVSGTAEEIEVFADAGKPALVYFCRKDVSLAQVDTDQLAAVRKFESSIRTKALYDSYGDDAEFASKLRRGLTSVVREHYSPSGASSKDVAQDEPPPDSVEAKGIRLSSPPILKEQAKLSARLESHGRHSHRLVIANTGTVEMSEVDVEVPPEATSFHLITNDLPIDILRPGERVAVLATMVMGGGASIFDVTIHGATPEGERLSYPSKISI